jgi:hypothetical protein
LAITSLAKKPQPASKALRFLICSPFAILYDIAFWYSTPAEVLAFLFHTRSYAAVHMHTLLSQETRP